MSKKPFQKNPVIEETYGSGRSSAHSRGVEPDSGGRNCGCSFPPDIAPWGRGWPELVQGQGSAAGGRGHPARYATFIPMSPQSTFHPASGNTRANR